MINPKSVIEGLDTDLCTWESCPECEAKRKAITILKRINKKQFSKWLQSDLKYPISNSLIDKLLKE